MSNAKSRIAVTTFNHSGYEKYGRRMLDTFEKFWPDDIRLIVVSEDSLDIKPSTKITFHDYGALVPEGNHFKAKFTRFSQAHGIMNAYNMPDARHMMGLPSQQGDPVVDVFTTPDGLQVTPKLLPAYYDYRFDAIRFSHKVFSIYGVSREYDADHLFWIDGDTYTHAPVDQRFFDETDPGDGYMSYLGRDEAYSECGFLVFNQRHPIHEVFLPQMISEYLNGDVFLLQEWHDSFIWDVHRLHYENTQGVNNRNLSGKAGGEEHPFINCVLGEYMDHLKGDERKEAGQSFADDWMANRSSIEPSSQSKKKLPDISVIQNIAQVDTTPYPHAWVEEALPEKIYRELEETLPVELVKSEGAHHIGGTSGDGENYRYKSAAALSDRKIPNIWLEFFEYHTSAEYFRSVIELFSPQIEELYPQYLNLLNTGNVSVRESEQTSELVSDCQFVIHPPLNETKTTRTPHLDNPIEIYAGLLYMKHPDDESSGGNFIVHETTAPITSINLETGREVDGGILRGFVEVPYKRNSYAMFLNVLNSVHSVSPRSNAVLDRVSINIIGEFNTDNRMWTENNN